MKKNKPEDRRNASRSPGAERKGRAGWGGRGERGHSAVELGQVESLQAGDAEGQGAELAPPLGVLSQDLSRLPPTTPFHRESHGALMKQEIKNDSSFPGTLETTGELAEGGESEDFLWTRRGGGGRAPHSYLRLPPHQAELWQMQARAFEVACG